MSLIRRLMGGIPRPGELVEIYERGRKIAAGRVIIVDEKIITIAGKGIFDLDIAELRRGMSDGSIVVKRQP
jgi:hypothetical protein